MRLLCIGKTGQIARALAEQSRAGGVDCLCLGRPELDLLKPDLVVEAIDRHSPTVIVNAAAFTNVDSAESDRDAAFALNADAPGALARLCAGRDLPLIQISTDYVFDGSGDQAWRETDAANPINVYGASKLAGENAVRAAGGRHVILRTSWVYSRHGNNFVKTMLRLADEQGVASVVDDQIGSPTRAEDIADAILDIAADISDGAHAAKFGTFHYSGAGSASWADVAAHIFSAFEQSAGCKIRLNRVASSDYPSPAERPRNSRLNTDKITRTFGIKPKRWTKSVSDVVSALLEEKAGAR